MAKGTTYDREKVLYLANQKTVEGKAFNVDVNESKNRSKHIKGGKFAMTTLEKIVPELVSQGLLVKAGTDDSDNYYQITQSGQIELLRLQIKYRKGKGKDVKDLEDQREYLIEARDHFQK